MVMNQGNFKEIKIVRYREMFGGAGEGVNMHDEKIYIKIH